MSIIRKYECGECGTVFEHFHRDRNEAPPDCPGCAAISANQTQVPAGFSIGGGAASRAGDITQQIVESDYGISNLQTQGLRAGDISAPPVPARLAPQVKNFFTANGPIIAAAKAGAAQAASEGRNPMALVQKVAKHRSGGQPARVICNPVNRVR